MPDMRNTQSRRIAQTIPTQRATIWNRSSVGAAVSKVNGILPVAMGLLFFGWECCRYLYLFRYADDLKLTTWLPDDAFYYLILGRNFALLHRWTFDGVAPATGFHLLWGYTIALIYWLAPNISLHQIFTVLYFPISLLVATALALACSLVRRLFGPFSILGPAAIFCISLAVQLPNFLMESGLVVFFSCLAVYLVFREERPLANWSLAAAFVVGVLGILSRSDFGLLPSALLFACLIMRRTVGAPRVKLAGSVWAGSIIGFVVMLGHTYVASGHLLQSSVRVKRHWSVLDGDSLWVSAWRAISPLIEYRGGWPPLPLHVVFVYAVGITLLLLAIIGAAKSRLHHRFTTTVTFAMSVAALGYIAFYSLDSAAVQAWYFANYLVLYSILAGSAFAIPGRVWRALSTIALGVWLWMASPIGRGLSPVWPQQVGFYQAGLYVRNHPELKPIGAWNAGIVDYLAPGGVVNLDGLVNDDAVPYVLSNSLKKYLAERRIYHVVDDSIMWESRITRAHGGYAGDAMTRCIDSKLTLWQTPHPLLVGDHLMLSTLDPQCLNGVDRH
jgi:hypothetical protein